MKVIFKFWVIIGFILLVNVSHAQQPVDHDEEMTSYGPVKSGEILWTIVARLPFDQSVNHHQIMLALLQANPQAFKNPCNLNSLKVGALLQIPSLSTINAINNTDAVLEITKQTIQWHNRKIQPINCPQPDAPVLVVSPTEIKPTASEVPKKIENVNPKLPVPVATSKTVVDSLPNTAGNDIHPVWDHTHITALMTLLLGGVIVGIMIGFVVIRKLWVTQPSTDKKSGEVVTEADFRQAPIEGTTIAGQDQYVTISIGKDRFEEWQFIKKYSDNYRFYPLVEASVIGLVTFVAIFLTSYFIFYYSLEAQKDEIREGLVRTAQALITTIDAKLHQTFTHKEQENTEAYQRAIEPFAHLLKLNTQIKFVYTAILKDDKIYFILDPTPNGDGDGDGVEDSVDIMQEYDDPSGLFREALKKQQIVVTKEPIADQWGSYFGAYVPFYDKDGHFVGILGMDITAANYYKRLEPIKRATVRAMVAGFFIAFIVGSLVWFTRHFSTMINRNRSRLLKELLNVRVIQSSDTPGV